MINAIQINCYWFGMLPEEIIYHFVITRQKDLYVLSQEILTMRDAGHNPQIIKPPYNNIEEAIVDIFKDLRDWEVNSLNDDYKILRTHYDDSVYTSKAHQLIKVYNAFRLTKPSVDIYVNAKKYKKVKSEMNAEEKEYAAFIKKRISSYKSITNGYNEIYLHKLLQREIEIHKQITAM
jgi:hypothetical protein